MGKINKEDSIKLTEKGIVLCEIWKLQTITITFGIIITIVQIFILIILLAKL